MPDDAMKALQYLINCLGEQYTKLMPLEREGMTAIANQHAQIIVDALQPKEAKEA